MRWSKLSILMVAVTAACGASQPGEGCPCKAAEKKEAGGQEVCPDESDEKDAKDVPLWRPKELKDEEALAQVSLSFKNISVKGPLDKEVILQMVAEREEQIRACWSGARAGDPAFSDTAVIEWIVGGDGKVVSLLVREPGDGKEAFQECLMGVIGGLLFPASCTGSINLVNLEIAFKPGQ